MAQTNANGNLSDLVVIAIFKEIVDTLKWEKENVHDMSAAQIFRSPSARKRLLIGMSPGPFSCIAGNIIASYYFGSELDTAGITNTNEQLKAVSSPALPSNVNKITYLPECCTQCLVPCVLPGWYSFDS